MSCEICGRQNCCRSFHSLREQNAFDLKTGKSDVDYYPEDDALVDLGEDTVAQFEAEW